MFSDVVTFPFRKFVTQKVTKWSNEHRIKTYVYNNHNCNSHSLSNSLYSLSNIRISIHTNLTTHHPTSFPLTNPNSSNSTSSNLTRQDTFHSSKVLLDTISIQIDTAPYLFTMNQNLKYLNISLKTTLQMIRSKRHKQ